MHATSVCLAVHRTKGTIRVLCAGSRKWYGAPDTNLPEIWAWGECESDEEKERKAKARDREERRAAMRAQSGA